MPRREPPVDAKLRQLAALQELDTGAREADVKDTAATTDMLKTLYGIQESQQLTPAHKQVLEAQAGYYGARGEDLPEERQARALELRLAGLGRAYGYDINNPEFIAARRALLKGAGFDIGDAAKPTPTGAYGGEKPPLSTSIPPWLQYLKQYPGSLGTPL